KGIAGVEAIPQLEFPDDVLPEPALPEVTQAHITALLGIKKGFGEILLGEGIDDVQAVRDLALGDLLRALHGFLDLDTILLGQPVYGLHEGIFLMLHQETDGIATTAASETFIEFLARGHR